MSIIIAGIILGVTKLFMVFVAVYRLLHSKKRKNSIAKKQVSNCLNNVAESNKGYVIDDIKFHDVNTNSSHEIDYVYVCDKGIIVVDTKHIDGKISGSSEDKFWTQDLNWKNEKNSFPSPERKNNKHIYELYKALGHQPFYNVVVFTNADITNVSSERAMYPGDLEGYVKKLPVRMSEYRVNKCYERLMEVKNEHVLRSADNKNINRYYRKSNKRYSDAW